jgi:hypothetical protein
MSYFLETVDCNGVVYEKSELFLQLCALIIFSMGFVLALSIANANFSGGVIPRGTF